MKFEIYKDNSGEWRWRLKAANNRIVAVSEGYKTKRGALRTIVSIAAEIKSGQIEIINLENNQKINGLV